MLEIIALIFLTRKNGELAENKGLKSLSWKIYTVIAWIGCELFVAFLLGMFGFSDNLILLALFALLGGFLGYLLVRQILNSKPDQESELEELAEHLTY